MRPMEAASQSKKPPITPEQVKKVFSIAETIHTYHSMLLEVSISCSAHAQCLTMFFHVFEEFPSPQTGEEEKAYIQQGFERRINNWGPKSCIGDYFLSMADFLRCYTQVRLGTVKLGSLGNGFIVREQLRLCHSRTDGIGRESPIC